MASIFAHGSGVVGDVEAIVIGLRLERDRDHALDRLGKLDEALLLHAAHIGLACMRHSGGYSCCMRSTVWPRTGACVWGGYASGTRLSIVVVARVIGRGDAVRILVERVGSDDHLALALEDLDRRLQIWGEGV